MNQKEKNSMKPILLGLLLLAAPAAVQAQYKYTTNSDGISLTITGYTGPPWAVTIPTNINGLTVTNIGTNAFNYHTNLTSVTIPGSVTNIGSGAFGSCPNLTNVTIPGSVTSIEVGAFELCDSLTQVTIPVGVTSIGEFAFQWCASPALAPRNCRSAWVIDVVIDWLSEVSRWLPWRESARSLSTYSRIRDRDAGRIFD